MDAPENGRSIEIAYTREIAVKGVWIETKEIVLSPGKLGSGKGRLHLVTWLSEKGLSKEDFEGWSCGIGIMDYGPQGPEALRLKLFRTTVDKRTYLDMNPTIIEMFAPYSFTVSEIEWPESETSVRSVS